MKCSAATYFLVCQVAGKNLENVKITNAKSMVDLPPLVKSLAHNARRQQIMLVVPLPQCRNPVRKKEKSGESMQDAYETALAEAKKDSFCR